MSEIAAALASGGDGVIWRGRCSEKLDEIKDLISRHHDAHRFAVEWCDDNSKALSWISSDGAAVELFVMPFKT